MRANNEGKGVSLLVPFRNDSGSRGRIWAWLKQYWAHVLPEADLVIGSDDGTPFSKTVALTDAAGRARGDVYVLLDADCYISSKVIMDCTERIRQARKRKRRVWFVPYRRFYRLTQETTELILNSSPVEPYSFRCPPLDSAIENPNGVAHGHWYGAMIQIIPSEAFWAVGGMDPRFRGWGGEDISFVRAVDTVYAKHKTTNNEVWHLRHERIGDAWDMHMWEGQQKALENGPLAIRYRIAWGDRAKMLALVKEYAGELPTENFCQPLKDIQKSV